MRWRTPCAMAFLTAGLRKACASPRICKANSCASTLKEQSIASTNSIEDAKLAEYMSKTTFKTMVGDVKFGSHGEWNKNRMLMVQHHDIKSNDIMQFKDMSTMTVVDPPEYADGKVIYPYENAKK